MTGSQTYTGSCQTCFLSPADFLQGVTHFTNLWWGASLHCAEAGLKGVSDCRALFRPPSGHTGEGLQQWWDGLMGG